MCLAVSLYIYGQPAEMGPERMHRSKRKLKVKFGFGKSSSWKKHWWKNLFYLNFLRWTFHANFWDWFLAPLGRAHRAKPKPSGQSEALLNLPAILLSKWFLWLHLEKLLPPQHHQHHPNLTTNHTACSKTTELNENVWLGANGISYKLQPGNQPWSFHLPSSNQQTVLVSEIQKTLLTQPEKSSKTDGGKKEGEKKPKKSESRHCRKGENVCGKPTGCGWHEVNLSANFPFISSLIISAAQSVAECVCGVRGGVQQREVLLKGWERRRWGTSLERKSMMLWWCVNHGAGAGWWGHCLVITFPPSEEPKS